MADPQQSPSLMAFASTSVSGQAFGGALAVIYLAYHHIPQPENGVDSKALEDAFTLIFSTGTSISFMILHVIFLLLYRKYLTPKS